MGIDDKDIEKLKNSWKGEESDLEVMKSESLSAICSQQCLHWSLNGPQMYLHSLSLTTVACGDCMSLLSPS
jgi:hypothetical protein